MEGIIFGMFALCVLLLFSAFQYFSLINKTENDDYQKQYRKRMLFLYTSAALLLIVGFILIGVYY